jgi:hypothetical protein
MTEVLCSWAGAAAAQARARARLAGAFSQRLCDSAGFCTQCIGCPCMKVSPEAGQMLPFFTAHQRACCRPAVTSNYRIAAAAE